MFIVNTNNMLGQESCNTRLYNIIMNEKMQPYLNIAKFPITRFTNFQREMASIMEACIDLARELGYNVDPVRVEIAMDGPYRTDMLVVYNGKIADFEADGSDHAKPEQVSSDIKKDILYKKNGCMVFRYRHPNCQKLKTSKCYIMEGKHYFTKKDKINLINDLLDFLGIVIAPSAVLDYMNQHDKYKKENFIVEQEKNRLYSSFSMIKRKLDTLESRGFYFN